MNNKLNHIAIITHNRPRLLDFCLQSLNNQTQKDLPPIILVDNDPQKSAQPVYKKWCTKLSITYVTESKQGAPYARNKAITYCQNGWLAFIDDDAMAHPSWVEAVTSALRNLQPNNKIGFIVGKVLLANPNSLAAQAQFLLHKIWFDSKINHFVAEPETLDTKNCVLNCRVLHQCKLVFDNTFVTDGISGHEDTDMGKKLEQFGFIGLYNPTIKVYHHEKSLSSGLLKKAYLRGVLRYRFDRKWKLSDYWIENAPDFRIYLPSYVDNIRRWRNYLRWLLKSRFRSKWGKTLIICIIQELFLCFFNQGYLDEKRRQEKNRLS